MIDYAASLMDDYLVPNLSADRGSQAFLHDNYSLAFAAMHGMAADAKVSEVSGDDMIKCILSGGVGLTALEEARVLEQMGLTKKTATSKVRV